MKEYKYEVTIRCADSIPHLDVWAEDAEQATDKVCMALNMADCDYKWLSTDLKYAMQPESRDIKDDDLISRKAICKLLADLRHQYILDDVNGDRVSAIDTVTRLIEEGGKTSGRINRR